MSRKKKQNPSVRSAITTVSVSLAAVAQTALAGPTGGVVAGGTATIDQSAALQTIINQATKKAVINWQEFDIPANELVKFVQAAGNDSVTLNRVLSNKFSNIQGALEANGNIFLINPNGIVFGANAKVDVAGLLASTLDVDPASFMSGDSLSFSQVQGKELASISNQGEIKVGDGGFVYLVAPKVDNSGMVIANIGRVTMAAGNRFNVDLQGSGLINFNVSADQLGSATGNAKVGVDNSGEIKAQNVLLQGNTAKDLMSSVVNNAGVIEATSLTINAAEIEQAGQIKSAAGTVNLTASDSIRTADGSSTRAGTLNLEVTNDGASIGAEGVALKVDADVLNAKAKNGHVLVTDVNGGVALGEITTGNKDNVNQRRAIIKSQNGSITSANPAKTNVTAWSTNLESDGAIGNAAQAVTTATDVLTASTQNGGIYVTDTDDQLILGRITARETLSVSGQPTALEAISDGSGQVTLSNGATGTKDVQIISQGSMFITGPVSATNFLGLGSFSGGLFNAADGTQLTGRNMTLIGDNVGQAERAFNIQSNKLDATARTGGVYITENNGLTVGSIQAGNGSDVVLKAAQGSLQVGSIVAQNGKVGLTADNGAILDNNGDALNVTAAELALNANTGIGASNNALETSVSKLAAATRAAQSGIYVKNNLALQSIDAQTANGDAQIDFSGGQLSFNRNSGQLSLNAPLDLTFTNSAGALVLAGIDAGSGHSVKLTAAGNISQGSGRLTAGDVTLDASNNIGSADTALVTDTASLDLTSRNGIVNVDNRSAQQTRVKASANSTNGAVSVKQAGALLVDSVSASKAVNLTAGGAIEGAADNAGFHVAAGSLNLDGAAIGNSSSALSTKVAGPMGLTSRSGDINLSNVGNISLLNANASGKIAFRNSGDASIDRLQAGQSITFDITGAAKNGGSGVNFIATGLDASAKSFGESGKAMQIQVQNLVIDTVNGGIYARQASGQLLGLMQATSGGSGSDIEISADGSIGLGTVNAGGNNVVLKAGGSIEDARSDKSKANVTARSLDMSAPGGIGMNGDLNLDVSFLSAAGGASGVKAANAGAIAVDNKTLTGKGNSEISIIAASITILDNNGGTITMDGGKLTMTATAGNIVFLNQSDTIYLPGGGSITLTAMSKSEMDGYSGVIIAGNLKTDGGDIKLQAQSNITIGMLDALGNAGTAGDVWVGSLHGIIIDGNGSAQNIRGDHVTLQASTPSLRDAELNRDTAISEYSAKVAEAAAKLLQLEILQQQLKSYQQMVSQAELQQSLAASIERLTALQQRAAQASVDSASAYVDILNTALNAATVVRNAAAIVAGAAQAIPFSGDAGADAAFAVVDLALSAATLALDSYERYTLAPRQDALDDLNNQLDVATAALTDAQTNLNMATTIRDTTQTSKDMADLAVFKANVARDAAQQVRKQAVSAYDLNKDIDSSADKPLGITANRLDVNQGGTLNTDLFLDSTGSIGLGDIEVASGKQIVASANQDLNLVGTVHSDKSISLNAGNSIQGAGGKLFTPDLLLKANNGIGNLTAVNTQVDRLAASAGNAGVNIVNRNDGKLLTVTSEGAVNGVSGNGDISIDTDGSLRVEKLISDTNQTHTVTLTSGGAIVDGNGQERNVQGGTLVVNALNGVELDSEIVRLQAQITGVGDFAIREASELVVDSLSTADGDIDVDATGNITVGSLSAAGHRIDLASGGRIDDDNNNATQIVANELGLTAAGSIGGTGAYATRALDTHVGSVDATAHGEINIAEQDDLSVGVVETDTGNITLTSGGSLDIGRVATGTTSDTITLMAANAIRNALNDGAANLTAANLALTAGSGIGEGKALNVSADRLVASGGSGGVEVTDLDGDLTIGGVTANLGLPTPFGLNSTGGDIRVQADGGSLFVDEMVVTLGGGDIALGAEGSLQQNAAVLGAANVSLTADDDITQNAVIVTSNGDIALAAGGSISQNALNLTVSGDISLQATDGDVTIAAGATNTVTGAGNITVEAGEDVVQNAAMSTGSGNISVKAGSGDVTIASAATSTVTGAGDITIEAGSNVQQGANFSTGTGDISVTAHTGNIEMGSGVSSIVGGTGNIAYNAGSNAVIGDLGSITGNIGVLAGGDIQQNGNIVTTTGDISLAADGDIQQAGDTGTDEGAISVAAGNDLLQNGNTTTRVGGITVNAGNDIEQNGNTSTDEGAISVAAGNDLLQNGNITTHAGAVSVAAGGNIQQVGDITTSVGGVEIGAAGNITQTGNIGTGTGDIAVTANGDLLQDGDTTATNGDIALLAHGNIRQNGAVSSGAGDISLAADGDIRQDGNIGTDAGDISVAAGQDILQNGNVSSGAGNIDVNAVRDITQNGDIRTDAGNINIAAGRDILQNGDVTSGAGDIAVNAVRDIVQNGVIGTDAGAIQIGAGNDFTQNGLVTTNAGDVAITAVGDIEQNADIEVGTGNLSVQAGGNLTMADGTWSEVGVGNIGYQAGGDLVSNIIWAGSGNVDVTAAQNLLQKIYTVAENGNLAVTATAGNLVMADGAVGFASGTVDYQAGADAELNVLVSEGADVTVNAGDNIRQKTFIATTDANIVLNAGSGDIGMDEGASSYVSGSGDIRYSAGRNILIDELATDDGDVRLTATAGSIGVHGSAADNVSANSLIATAANGIGSLGNAVRTRIDSLVANLTGAGDIAVTEADGIELTQVRNANGTVAVHAGGDITAVDVQSRQGSVQLDSAGRVDTTPAGLIQAGALQIDAVNGVAVRTSVDRASVAVSGTGDLSIGETDGIVLDRLTTADGDIAVNAGGNIGVDTVLANGDVSLNSGAAISSQRSVATPANAVVGNRIALQAASGIGAQRALDIAGQQVSAQTTGGDIRLAQAGAVVLENVRTGNGNINVAVKGGDAQVGQVSANGAVNLSAANGSLRTDGSGNSRVSAGDLALRAANGIALNTAAGTLDARLSGAGDIAIDELDGLASLTAIAPSGDISVRSASGNIAVDSVQASGHAVSLQADRGAIRDAHNGTSNNVTAARLTLSASTGIGLPSNAFDITVGSLSAQTGSGGIYINNWGTAPLVLESASGPALQTGTGDIVLNTAGRLNVEDEVRNTGNGSISLNAAGDIAQDADVRAQGSGNISLKSGGSIDMGDGVTTASNGGNIRYEAAGQLSVSQVETSRGAGGGVVTFVAPEIIDNMPGVANVKAWVIDLQSPTANKALVREMIGETQDQALIRLNFRPIGGSLAESRRFMADLLNIPPVATAPTTAVLTSGVISDTDITADEGYNADGEGNLRL